jgi:hypothetical protein
METFKNDDDSDAASPAAAELLFNSAIPKTLVQALEMKREAEQQNNSSVLVNSPEEECFHSRFSAKTNFAAEVIEPDMENLRVQDLDEEEAGSQQQQQQQQASVPCSTMTTPEQYLAASPLQAATGYRAAASPSHSCQADYKEYGSSAHHQLTQQYNYRSEQQQSVSGYHIGKDIVPTSSSASMVVAEFEADHNKCMEGLPDGGFNLELFKNAAQQQLSREEGLLYREDGAARSFLFARESSSNNMYQNELDAYRNLCCQQQQQPQYEGARGDYDGYKYDAVVGSMDLKSGGGVPGGGNTASVAAGGADQSERQPEKQLERLNSRSEFDLTEYQILEQVINEERLSERSSSTATKRYDPKYRALAEAFKQTEPEMSGGGGGGAGGVLGAELFAYAKQADACQQAAKWERADLGQSNKWDRLEGEESCLVSWSDRIVAYSALFWTCVVIV